MIKTMVHLISLYQYTDQLLVPNVPSYTERTDTWYMGVYQCIARTDLLSDQYVLSVPSNGMANLDKDIYLSMQMLTSVSIACDNDTSALNEKLQISFNRSTVEHPS